MIAKANLGKGFGEVSGYVLETKNLPIELHPKLIETNNLVHTSANKIAEEMKAVASFNDRAKKPVMHMQISFHPDEKLTEEQAKKAIDSILTDIGIDRNKHQFIVVEHFEKPHQHYHVVCNRVDFDGKLLNDSHLKIRLNVASDKVEKEQGLRATEGRQFQFDTVTQKGKFVKIEKERSKKLPKNNNPKIQEAKQQINDKIIDVLHTAKTAEEFKEKLGQKGVEVRFSQDRANNNAIKGASFRTDDIAIKGGDIGYKWDEINAILEHNNTIEKAVKTPLEIKLEQKKEEYQQLIDSAAPSFDQEQIKPGHNYVEEYNSAIEQYLKSIENNQKNIYEPEHEAIREFDLRIDQIAKKSIQGKEFIKENIGEDVRKIDRLIDNIKLNKANAREAYKQLQEQQPEQLKPKILGLVYGENSEIISRNEALEKRKSQPAKAIEILDTTQFAKSLIKPLPKDKRVELTLEDAGKVIAKKLMLKKEIEVLEKQVYQEKNPSSKGKQAEMESQVIILEQNLIKIKQETQQINKETPNDFKKLKEFQEMQLKAQKELSRARYELSEYKDKVEQLQEQNEDLTILQIDKIIREQEEKGEERGNSTPIRM